MTRDEIVQLVEAAARSEGVSPEALLAIANLESSGNVNAQNPRSSASGLFQFVDSTAREYGLTGSKRNDPTAQAYAAAKMMATNSRSLERSLGREPSPGELYLAHQQGLGGATALLKNPDKPAVEVLAGVYKNRARAEQAVRLNGGNTGQTAGQFAGQWVNKANQRVAAIPPGSVPNTVGSQMDVQPRAVQGFPTPRPVNPSNPPLPQPRPQRTADVPLPRLDPRKPNRMDMAADVPTVERRLPPIFMPGGRLAGQERGPTTAPRKPVVTPTPAQAEAATGFRLPGQSAPPAMTREEQRADNGQDRPTVAPRVPAAVPGPSAPPKTQDRLDTGQAVIVPRSGTVQPTKQQVEQATGFRLPPTQVTPPGMPTPVSQRPASPLTEEVEVENPAYTALMKRVQQGEIELKGIAPSGMAMSRDARARYDQALADLEAKRQQLAGMSRTTTVTRQVRQPVAQPVRPVVKADRSNVINPANHNAEQLAAMRAGQSSYTPAGGGPSMPVYAMNGKLRNTYADGGNSGSGGSLL